MKIPVVVPFLLVSIYRVRSDCRSPFAWMPDPSDCNQFYLCSNGMQFKYACPENTVADIINKACVPRGSTFDKCSIRELNLSSTIKQTIKPTKTTPQATQKVLLSICQKAKILPVSNNCAQYLKCTSTFTATLEECSYPKLFNAVHKKCEMPALVNCGKRYEPLDPCEYSENHCTKSHCFPCSIRFPSCRGLPDGLNPWNGREGSPYFAICKSQRVVLQGKCSYEENSDEQIFDSRLRVCVKVTA